MLGEGVGVQIPALKIAALREQGKVSQEIFYPWPC